MTTVQALPRGVLYEHDETAWLETMAELIRLGRLDEIDYPNLAEYLADMARRDRREVDSRLTVLIVHALKWAHQPDRRSGSWKATIIEQRQETWAVFPPSQGGLGGRLSSDVHSIVGQQGTYRRSGDSLG
jgi:hypothetical protein